MKGRFLIASITLAIISLIAANILLPNIVETYTTTYATRYSEIMALIIGTIDALSNLPVAYTGNTLYTMLALWFIAGLITGAIIRKPESSLVGGMLTGLVFGLILIFVLASEQGIDIKIVFKDLLAKSPEEVYYRPFYVEAVAKLVYAFMSTFIGAIASAISSAVLLKPEIPKQEMPEEMYTIKTTCPSCGAEFLSTPMYCSVCGIKLRETPTIPGVSLEEKQNR